MKRVTLAAWVPLCFLFSASAGETPPLTPDIPEKFEARAPASDFSLKEVMIPMRDGVKLHTVIVIPRGASSAPIVLTRTPYDAMGHVRRDQSTSMAACVPQGHDVFAEGGYICVFQDIRGKFKSEGAFVMTRVPRGPLNSSGIDDTTDAWDTIEWLSKNVPESNGKVGMVGSSYEGFTVVMALLDPPPALRVAASESPMVNGWMGDDWFHYGAFRQVNFDYFAYETEGKDRGEDAIRPGYDDYDNFLRAGSASGFARAAGLDGLPFWRKLSEHPAYDEFWRNQALEALIGARPLKVPTLWVQGLWDQEDIYGAIHCFEAQERLRAPGDCNFLVLGPWRHSQENYPASSLGPLEFPGDTGRQFRSDVLRPFFDRYLKDGATAPNTPRALVYNTGANCWERFSAWPPVPGERRLERRPLYLEPDFRLSFKAPPPADPAYDEYGSDPAKPVPYVPRPVRFADREAWKRWLVTDQREFATRTDVLTYASEPMSRPLAVSGASVVHLIASTSGTDCDWVVKLIDAYPEEFPGRPEMGGYQLPVAMDIFRGRYRTSFSSPQPVASGQPLPYVFALPPSNHVFLPGHRVVVQIQSSWFPLYDRNPQTFVPNIFLAQPGDYVRATQRVYRAGSLASFLDLPVVAEDAPTQAQHP